MNRWRQAVFSADGGNDELPCAAIGWDVGGWNCDRNPASRDALVVLGPDGCLLGQPWRGNLRKVINRASDSRVLLAAVAELCQVKEAALLERALIAIDTPLGFSPAFTDLVNRRVPAGEIGDSSQNPYLFRESEFQLFSRGWRPLSPVKDMIGSQATKGIHFLAKFAPEEVETALWSDGHHLAALESYPSVCRHSPVLQKARLPLPPMRHADMEDALWCALLAQLFLKDFSRLLPPTSAVQPGEGWIWVPADARPPGMAPAAS
jgi:hypothetical protein